MSIVTFEALVPLAVRIGGRLIASSQTVAVAESAAGGLISAALLSVPGASAFYRAGAVVYTPKARVTLMGLSRADMEGLRGASEAYAALLADRARDRFAASFGVAETGASGPAGNPYGDPAGHACLAVSGSNGTVTRTLRTGSDNRVANMAAFAEAALLLLEEQL
jgi:nicotinamide-nucleotide amidase